MLRILNNYGHVCLVVTLLIVATGFRACEKQNSNQPSPVKDIRRDIAVQIHRVENTLLRITEFKRDLLKKGKLDKDTNVRISRTLIQLNDITLSANDFLSKTINITPKNKEEVLVLIQNSLSFANELNQDGGFITDSESVKEFLELVKLLQTAILAAQVIIEGVK